MVNENIFKSYDVRGIYPAELDDQAAHLIGQAFVKHTGAHKIVLAFDARVSGPSLLKNIAAGIKEDKADVWGIGQLPTECLYFTVGFYDFDAGIMITASHNPKEYNGFKMIKKHSSAFEIAKGNVKSTLEMVRGKDLIEKVKAVKAVDRGFMDLVIMLIKIIVGERKPLQKDIFPDYIKFLFSFVDGEIKPFKVVIDTSNGVMGKIIGKIKNRLPVRIIDLNFQPDGNFPNHSPNPLEAGSTDQISWNIRSQKADFGFIFDGDGDRVFLVDEQGRLVSADISLLLLAKYLLQKNPGSAIAYNAICSKAVPEFIKKWGGKPVRTSVGFVNVREGLIKNEGIMGGELSGHYCFKNYFYMDSGLMAFLTLLQAVSQDGRKVSEIVRGLSPYFKSAEQNFKTEKKEIILLQVKEKYADGKQDFLDGITVEYPNWWFNLRPSNTEPLLRLTIEADSQEMLKLKKEELSKFIADHG